MKENFTPAQDAFIAECLVVVEARMKSETKRFIKNCQDLQDKTIHPNWRTAEVMVKLGNQAIMQIRPDVGADFLFYIHFDGDEYWVDTTPPKADEVEE